MTQPVTMRAVEPSAPGGPDVLTVKAVPVPKPGAGQVLIRVAWAGVNPHDIGQRTRGSPPPGQTPVLGLEVSGEIVDAGDAAGRARIGKTVCALVQGGGYADYCLSHEPLAFDQPARLDARQSAALMENLFTAWFNMFDMAELKAGERMLVHGGTGNIGSTAVMLARLMGAEAFATVGTEEKRKVCEGLGATRAINYRDEDFVEAINALTGGQGVDFVFDTVASGYAEKNLKALKQGGRVAYVSGGKQGAAAVPVSAIMAKRAKVMGSLMRGLELPLKLKVAAALKEKVWPVLGSKITPLIDSAYPLEQAAEAHRRSESGEAMGKILIRVGG